MLSPVPAPVDLIARIPLFADLDPHESRVIAESMKERRFEGGSVVVSEGESGVGFFVIGEGSARVTVGGRPVGELGAGDYFGEIALIGAVERTATITAETDLVCYGMTSWAFKPLVESHASIAWKLLQNLARQLSHSDSRG
jgi:CRP-like cAMP-binding protein